MPSAATMTETGNQVVEDPIAAFLSRLVILDPSPFLPPDYVSSRKEVPREEIAKETSVSGQMIKESVEDTDEKEAISKSREAKKSTSSYSPQEHVAIGSLGALIGNGKHNHTAIKSVPARVSPDYNDDSRQIEDLQTKMESKATASVPSSGFRISNHKQMVEATTTPMNLEDETRSTNGLNSQAQVVLQPLNSCGYQCLIVGTLAISSGLEWTDALRHPSSLGFKKIESKVTRALIALLWKTRFVAFLDLVEVAQFVPGRIGPVVLVDVLLQFSNFNVKPTAHLLFQALTENLVEGNLPDTDFKVDISKTYFLVRSTGESISCQENNLDVPHWSWLALIGGLTSFAIIVVTCCIVVLRRLWRSRPSKLNK